MCVCVEGGIKRDAGCSVVDRSAEVRANGEKSATAESFTILRLREVCRWRRSVR